MTKNILGSLLCSALLVACVDAGGGGGGDAGSSGGDGGGSVGGDHTPPTVAEGEAAMDVYDSATGTKYEFRCSAASGSFSTSWQEVPDSVGGGVGFMLFCNDASGEGATLNQRGFNIGVYDDSLAPGTYEVFPEQGVPVYDTFTFNAVDDGEGISLPNTMNGGIRFDGDFTVTENAGPGGAFRATFAISYERISVVTGGVSTEVVDRPGEAVGAMHLIVD